VIGSGGGGSGHVAGGANLVVNGSFEDGPNTGSYLTLRSGDDRVRGWTITKGTIDLVGTELRASHGDKSVDLIGSPGSGGIRQIIQTVPGQTYLLGFQIAGNMSGGDKVKQMRVKAAGSVDNVVTFDTAGHSNQSPGWEERTLTFRAYSTETELEFSHPGEPTNGAFCGPMLDNVVVVPVFR
jgi:choice-of-anchor C domain-containing protein